jgi:hypothetical protein
MFLKFETNPTIDLRGKIILVKNLEVCSWKSFHELHYNYLHTIPSVFFYLHTFSSMNNISSHITTSFPLKTHSPSLPKKKTQDTKKIFSLKLSMTPP